MALNQQTVMVTGAAGMLAGDLIPRLLRGGWRVQLFDLKQSEVAGCLVAALDITSFKDVSNAVSDVSPEWLINCAAYTQVDAAESNEQAAFAVNGSGAGNLARALSDVGGKMLHISTDYVFGGPDGCSARRTPYLPEDKPDPCGVYGKSKHLGEVEVVEALPESHLVLRTSWLHGIHGHNFVNTMLKLAKERTELSVVDDQVGSPTWAGWLAEVMVELIEKDARGTFHATSRGGISWLDFAREIFRVAGAEVELKGQTTEELGREAPRPRYSTLDVGKLESLLGRQCITWQEGVARHLEALRA
ncbi:MAG: dTDP-4-dehydrorhamnose reductase [Bdellovibrionales bacterium]|nr:dTDP-4-dehydrorhamnose reductase [Bdellovibrionales bacterium]